jgi:hypothetical protein
MMRRAFQASFVASVFLVSFAPQVRAADPCKSGLAVGKRPGPYSAVVVTGSQRGQSYCYICETAERPAVVVFARRLSDPLGKLVRGLDKALETHRKAKLRAWVTFLAEDTANFEAQVGKWGKQQAVANLPLAVFSDNTGPPSYRLASDADVTVILFVKHKVAANFAFRGGELTDACVAEVLKALPRIVGGK